MADYTPEMQVVGIKQTSAQYDVWRLTFNGNILGDSRGYRRADAIREARTVVARQPRWHTLDPSIAE